MDTGIPEDETVFSMRVVTRMTGLSADTIRKWEQRYAAVTPHRTEGNTRKFTAANVRRLGMLHELTARGHNIKDVARLSDQRLEAMLAEPPGAAALNPAPAVEQAWSRLCEDYLAAIRGFDARRAAGLLSRAAGLLSPAEFVYEVALPILRQVGEQWSRGKVSPAHEHLASSQIRSVITAILHWNSPQPGARKVLVTTPEGHLHELGVMMGALLAANRGFEPVYLGPDLPLKDIRVAVDLSRAELVLLSVIRDVSDRELAKLADILRALSARIETWVGLPAAHRLLRRKTGARYLNRFQDLDMALTQFGNLGRL